MVAKGEGGFDPVEVKAGATAGGQSEILEGLKAGQQVVVSGQFLIDSEASLRGTVARMQETTSGPRLTAPPPRRRPLAPSIVQ